MKRILIFSLLLFLQENLSAQLPDLIPYRKGNLWGYCDSMKKMIIEPKYKRAYPFDKGFGIVEIDSSSEIIDEHGAVQLRIQDGKWESTLLATMREKEFIFSGANGKCGVIDIGNDTIIKPDYYEIRAIDKDYYMCFKKKGFELVNRNSRIIFKIRKITDYGFTDVHFVSDLKVFIVQIDRNSCGVIDTNGITKIPFIYYEVSYDTCQKFSGFVDNKHYYFTDHFDEKFQKISSQNNCKVDSSEFKMIPVETEIIENGREVIKHGWIAQDFQGGVVHAKYESTGYFSNGFAQFELEGKFGFVNEKFEEVIESKYDHLKNFESNSLAVVSKLSSQDKHGNKQYKILGYIDIYGIEYWED
jgi:hypothetical protein